MGRKTDARHAFAHLGRSENARYIWGHKALGKMGAGGLMENKKLTTLIAALSPAQQAIVEEFVKSLQGTNRPSITFREALDEFKRKHPELLRLLAQ
jgi:hypothetical protein